MLRLLSFAAQRQASGADRKLSYLSALVRSDGTGLNSATGSLQADVEPEPELAPAPD